MTRQALEAALRLARRPRSQQTTTRLRRAESPHGWTVARQLDPGGTERATSPVARAQQGSLGVRCGHLPADELAARDDVGAMGRMSKPRLLDNQIDRMAAYS